MKDAFDALVVGAGIGGLTAASILASEGMDVAVLEREDRVGGRALSMAGAEISDRGAEWYRGILGRHYCYLADSDPGIDRMVAERTLDGYTLDLGYHGVPCGGRGYLGRLTNYLGIEVKVNPCDTGFYYDGTYYNEPGLNETRLDDRMFEICKAKNIDYWAFHTVPMGMSSEELDGLEEVSLFDYCDRIGLTADDVIWQSYRCNGTLYSTINNPHDISAGEMIRYSRDVLYPLIASDEEAHIGGFAEGGILNWSRAVAGKFERTGGELFPGTDVRQVKVEDGRVAGAVAAMPGGEEMFLRAPVVISNVPVQETFEIVDPREFPKEFVSRMRSLYGYGSLAPYFGLNELPIPLEQAERLTKTPVVVPAGDEYDYDVYMCWNVQSITDPTCAPPGKYMLTAYLPLTEEESRDRGKVMKAVRAVPSFLDSVYPGFSDCVDWALYPVCWKLEGVAKSISQAGTLKPDVKAEGPEGLYFAGDTARGFGVAMDCACSAGINCAASVLGRDIGIE